MAISQQIQALASGFSIETTPGTAAKVESFKAILPAGTMVNVTFLPGTDYRDTVATAARLRAEGMVPVPHIAARSIRDVAALEEYLKRLRSEARVDRRRRLQAGRPFRGLRSASGNRPVREIRYPQDRHRRTPRRHARHPSGRGREGATAQGRYAHATGAEMYLVTQFSFEAKPVTQWIDRLRAIGIRLPVWIGVPGPASIKTLLRFAQECGIGPSMRVVTRQARNVAKLLTVQTPDALLAELAAFRAADPEGQLRGIHLYPFGGFAKTCAWFSSVAEGRFALARDGSGFTLTQPPAAAAS